MNLGRLPSPIASDPHRGTPLSRTSALALASVLACFAANPAAAAPSIPGCLAPAALSTFKKPLPHFLKQLAGDGPLTIVALGSSSTFGLGASSPQQTYPSRLEAELKERYPGRAIRVINHGVNGNETRDEMARFEHDVLAEKPDLVIWQVGTNTLLNGHDMWPVYLDLESGIARLRAQDADVVLMNMQYSPKVLSRPNHDAMDELIKVASRELDVDMFDRYAIMRGWMTNQHLSFDRFVTADGLHMNDWGYGCIAHLLAAAITTAPAVEVAHTPAPGMTLSR